MTYSNWIENNAKAFIQNSNKPDENHTMDVKLFPTQTNHRRLSSSMATFSNAIWSAFLFPILSVARNHLIDIIIWRWWKSIQNFFRRAWFSSPLNRWASKRALISIKSFAIIIGWPNVELCRHMCIDRIYMTMNTHYTNTCLRLYMLSSWMTLALCSTKTHAHTQAHTYYTIHSNIVHIFEHSIFPKRFHIWTNLLILQSEDSHIEWFRFE